MPNTGIFLSRADLEQLSPPTRHELVQFLFQTQKTNGTASADGTPAAVADDPKVGDGSLPPDLSVAQAVKLVQGCSARPKRALRFIADRPSHQFSYKQLTTMLGFDSSGTIRGTLSAITRRARTVLGDHSADLIWWQDDDAEEYIGSVSPATYAALRKAFGI
jgi:hypothetical protein